jgi:hypothetical protein
MFCEDALPWAHDVLFWLLLKGADWTIQCNLGKTSLDYAQERDDGGDWILETIKLFEIQRLDRLDEITDKQFVKRVKDSLAELDKKYAYHYDPLITVSHFKADFPLPDFIFEPQKVGSLPRGMKIHEHQIKPLIRAGEDMTVTMDVLKCLEFSKDQAEVNQIRREKLLQHQNPNWVKPEKPSFVQKKRRKKRSAVTGALPAVATTSEATTNRLETMKKIYG